ncbi:potassium-transporting ATPase subunit B [Streptomyces lavendofoliae]|uniref:Potassium-transporting ATPase subunit B n=2 Tax=Streptomyces lavendofoliae TaxID=67314 RepID=A0A918M5B3_9ACTN|nr:potassium-transporting ATPase subunit B [Streptomyces lavendofoliae]
MTRDTVRTLHALRGTVRRIAITHRLPAEARARLVLSLSDLCAAPLSSGRLVTLTSDRQAGRDGTEFLTLRSRFLGRSISRTAVRRLPLPGEITPCGDFVWRLAIPPLPPDPNTPASPGTGPGPASALTPHTNPFAAGPAVDMAFVEEELRAALDHSDALAAELSLLERELIETNSGVLALYVQLEERDQALRRSHGQVLRALEDALRPRPLHVNGLEMAVHYAPASDDSPTGGDLYDWFTLPDGTVHITLVDALGHGVTSTRTALTVTHAVRTLALEGHPLDSIVARTDAILRPYDHDVMATLLLARLDPATGHLALANGSHPPALVIRGNRTADYLEVRGRGVGYPSPGSDRVLTTTLHPGDLLLLYTDGLTESRRDPVEGEARLIDAARRHRSHPTAVIPGAIASDMLGDALHNDDTLAIAARLLPHPFGGGRP